MASSSRRDYTQAPQVDDEDLIDPDDGKTCTYLSLTYSTIRTESSSPRDI
jgi:hypothetical protein